MITANNSVAQPQHNQMLHLHQTRYIPPTQEEYAPFTD